MDDDPKAPIAIFGNNRRIGFGRGGQAVRQPYAALQHLQQIGHRPFFHIDLVFLLDFEPGVRQSLRQLAVVGEQQKSLRIIIQTTHRVDPFGHAGGRGQIRHRLPALRILQRRDDPIRFIQ